MNEILDKFDLLIKRKLSFNQFFYLYLIYSNRIATLYKYQTESKFPLTKDEINHLFDLGYITEEWTDEYPDNANLTKKGKKVILEILGEKNQDNLELKKRFWVELYETYPKYWGIQKFVATGLKAILTLDGKIIEGAPAYADLYYKNINGDEKLHEEIIKKIEWAKEQNAPDNINNVVSEIHCTLASFIVDMKWKNIEIKETNARKLY